jgi:hypothetical protein
MRRAISVCLLALAVVACGDDDDEPPPPASDEEQIVATVNEMFDAVEDDDGEAVCSALTERGQGAMHTLAIREFPTEIGEGADCEAAVAVITEQVADEQVDDAADHTYVVDDVSIDAGGARAYVQCEFRGSISLQRVGTDWLVEFPGCLD